MFPASYRGGYFGEGSMRQARDREAVDRLARAVLARPELNDGVRVDGRAELEHFPLVAAAFHAAPRAGRRGGRRDEALGFGVGEVGVAVTTLVLVVVTDALTQLAHEQAQGGISRFRGWFRRTVLRRPELPAAAAPEAGPAALTPEQLRLVHRSAVGQARRLRLPEEVAENVANGVVAELTMAQAAPDGPPDTGGESGE
ncbi:hypothetical protein ACPCKV_06750 [Streptomyces koyangensis]|uniref:hypothetical protein n=2 Tax=Streptomyces TaxID=1883 RepID=UPI003C2FF874